jgi:Lrp/AsnC family leucine-responsive transcriptional regulator
VQDIFANKILNSSLELIPEIITYSRGFLVNRPGKTFPTRGDNFIVRTDRLELNLLHALRQDGRASVRQLAAQFKTTSAVVSYRIKKLEDLGLIGGYRLSLNSEQIGLQRFRVELAFASSVNSCKELLRDYSKKCPSITRLEYYIGAWPAEIGLEAESFSKLHEILDDLRTLASGKIQINDIIMFRRTHAAPSASWKKILGL